MRVKRTLVFLLVAVPAFALGALTALAVITHQVSEAEVIVQSKNPAEDPCAQGNVSAELCGGQMTADSRWSLPPNITRVGGAPYGGKAHTIIVDRISGKAPYGPFGSLSDDNPIVAVGEEFTISLTAKELTKLNAEGHLCVMSSIVLQLPESDTSNLDQLMNECNNMSAVAMTVVISEVL